MVPLGMETALVADGASVGVGLIVDVIVKVGYVLGSVVSEGNAGSAGEGHLEVAVHGAVLHRDGQRPPRLILLAAMAAGNVFVLEAGAEEVADGDFDAGIGFPVPVHAEHQLAQMERRWRVDGEPDVTDCAGSLNVGQ